MPCAISKQSIFTRQWYACAKDLRMCSTIASHDTIISMPLNTALQHVARLAIAIEPLVPVAVLSLFPPREGWQQGGAVARLRHRQRCYSLLPYTCLTVPRFVLSLAPRSSQHRARPPRPTTAVLILPPCGGRQRGCRDMAESTRLLTGHCIVHP